MQGLIPGTKYIKWIFRKAVFCEKRQKKPYYTNEFGLFMYYDFKSYFTWDCTKWNRTKQGPPVVSFDSLNLKLNILTKVRWLVYITLLVSR